jgi:2-methylcitrate dehydratase
MEVIEDPLYSSDYLDPEKRSIANAVQVFFKDGSATEKIDVEYPVGHRRRRAEGIPLLIEKFEANLASRLDASARRDILNLCSRPEALAAMPIDRFMDMLTVDSP